MKTWVFTIFFIVFVAISCNNNDDIIPVKLQLIYISVGNQELDLENKNVGLDIDQPIVLRFSHLVDTNTVKKNITITLNDNSEIKTTIAYLDGFKTVSLKPIENLSEKTDYIISINKGLTGINGEVFSTLQVSFTTKNQPLEITKVIIDGTNINDVYRIKNIGFNPLITAQFNSKISLTEIKENTSLELGSLNYSMDISSQGDTLFTFKVTDDLPYYRKFKFIISSELGSAVEREFDGLTVEFYTQLDSMYKFPAISDDELLTLIQKQTFKYFWDFAHPVSGLIRERNTSNETVTSGGSGFGLMAIIVGIERGFISRSEGITRINKIINFLESADRFHGAWPHWLNGTTGTVIPFSSKDDGGDLVETSYLVMGLLTVKQYLNPADATENQMINKINALWEAVEWNWYTQGGQNVLYWHWSPNYEWEKNHKISGYNEALITYIIAASSPTYGISSSVYHEGWALNGDIVNGNSYYDIILPLGNDYGGPLFFEQYTFLGIDPTNLSDIYANYWDQVVNHTLINRTYCIDNPKNYIGYSSYCWGLTASDGNDGYSAHSPTNDRGVITPTAAISSIPFTPEKSMDAIKLFYYMLGDRLWGEYGFYDAFNITENWTASSFLAIDQGPIIIMIENYRSGLCWDLFMQNEEIQSGLTQLGFTY